MDAYFHDVLLDDLRIVAHGLNEEELKAHLADDDVAYQLASLDRGIRGVENGHLTVAALQPLADVVQGVFRALRAYRHGFYIVGTEELVALIGRGRVSPVLAQIEDLRADADPVKVAAELLGYVRLAAGWQADHRDHVWLVHEIRAFTCDRQENNEYRGKHNCKELILEIWIIALKGAHVSTLQPSCFAI